MYAKIKKVTRCRDKTRGTVGGEPPVPLFAKASQWLIAKVSDTVCDGQSHDSVKHIAFEAHGVNAFKALFAVVSQPHERNVWVETLMVLLGAWYHLMGFINFCSEVFITVVGPSHSWFLLTIITTHQKVNHCGLITSLVSIIPLFWGIQPVGITWELYFKKIFLWNLGNDHKRRAKEHLKSLWRSSMDILRELRFRISLPANIKY